MGNSVWLRLAMGGAVWLWVAMCSHVWLGIATGMGSYVCLM